jgi:hypothetical protein
LQNNVINDARSRRHLQPHLVAVTGRDRGRRPYPRLRLPLLNAVRVFLAAVDHQELAAVDHLGASPKNLHAGEPPLFPFLFSLWIKIAGLELESEPESVSTNTLLPRRLPIQPPGQFSQIPFQNSNSISSLLLHLVKSI